ncbi:MAG: helix-turn-helix domain-containing protein [Oscillospiraceae bacterium]|nr:helix-turn-helix domain-containing protein [Oscillospiraceae bacterium]
MFSKELYGQRLLEIRNLHNETQSDLAKSVGTAISSISEMEKGKKTTTLERFAMICEHYHVSADYLLGLSDDPKLPPVSPPET